MNGEDDTFSFIAAGSSPWTGCGRTASWYGKLATTRTKAEEKILRYALILLA
jgi:hypothetical protein